MKKLLQDKKRQLQLQIMKDEEEVKQKKDRKGRGESSRKEEAALKPQKADAPQSLSQSRNTLEKSHTQQEAIKNTSSQVPLEEKTGDFGTSDNTLLSTLRVNSDGLSKNRPHITRIDSADHMKNTNRVPADSANIAHTQHPHPLPPHPHILTHMRTHSESIPDPVSPRKFAHLRTFSENVNSNDSTNGEFPPSPRSIMVNANQISPRGYQASQISPRSFQANQNSPRMFPTNSPRSLLRNDDVSPRSRLRTPTEGSG